VTKDVVAIARSVLERHSTQEGALLPILRDLQDEFGYLPEQALPLVAETLNLSRAEVYGVATFYHDFHFEPHGEHTITLCRAEACQSVGAVALGNRAKSRLGLEWGETSADGRVTLEQTFCLGLCACGPAGMIDGRPVARITPSKLDAMIAEAGE
jgi:formate dehydrogenase subunit gamma